jgi:HK97 family phage portal protein
MLRVKWPWTRREAIRDDLSIGDPALAGYFGTAPTYAGVNVTERSALGIAAFWRAVMLIAGTIASLPLKSIGQIDDQRQPVRTWLDDPGTADGQTPYEWKETCLLHALLHGNTYLQHIYNGAGGLVGATPLHPLSVTPSWERLPNGRFTGRKVFDALLGDGTRRQYTSATMTQVMGPSLDGLRGLSLLGVARQSLGTSIAGERAAAKMFGNGALISGLVSTEEDVDNDEAEIIKAGLDQKLGGWENAGEVAFVNRKLRFTPWTMSAEDAQFLQSRQFQIEEVARWTGVPPHLLMQTEKQTSWGTGVAEQNRGLGRFTLLGWTMRFEQRLSRLIAGPGGPAGPRRFAEFEFAGLERPTPENEIKLLIEQVKAGLLTVNEARRIRNLPPIDGGDVLRTATTSTGTRELQDVLA